MGRVGVGESERKHRVGGRGEGWKEGTPERALGFDRFNDGTCPMRFTYFHVLMKNRNESQISAIPSFAWSKKKEPCFTKVFSSLRQNPKKLCRCSSHPTRVFVSGFLPCQTCFGCQKAGGTPASAPRRSIIYSLLGKK